jgi:hypothetical protein
MYSMYVHTRYTVCTVLMYVCVLCYRVDNKESRIDNSFKIQDKKTSIQIKDKQALNF